MREPPDGTTRIRYLVALGSALLFLTTAATTSPEADRVWQAVLEQASGPGVSIKTREEAVRSAQTHLDKQEATLRGFLGSFPADPRHYSASVRLSGVLSAKSRLLKQPALRVEARKILTDIESNPGNPPAVKADAAFARITQAMEEAAGRADVETRDELALSIRGFDTAYPADRRTAGLLTEIASLYDAQPERKRALLDEAAARTTDESLRQRIEDDRKRLAHLGVPLDLQLTPWQGGAPVKLATLRGRVVVLLFWASWSLPALHELANLEGVAARFADQPVDFLTVSLDTDRKALSEACEAGNLRWLVQCDGRGWEGETVRSLGINALPTVWILDRRGNLLTLNARGTETAEQVQKALSQK